MSNSPTLPMIGPDGSPALIPHENVQAAANAGAKPAIKLYGPDGTPAYVPLANLGAALKAGAKTEGQYQQDQTPATAPKGFAQSLVAPIPQAAQGIYHAFTDAPQNATEANVKGTSPDSGIAARTLGQIGLGAYRTLIAPSVAAEKTAEGSVAAGHPLQALSEAAEGIPLVGAGVSAGRQAISQYLSGDKSGAAGSVLGNLLAGGLGAATTGEVAARTGPVPTVPGENYTPSQLRAHTGILGRMNGLGDNFIPQDSAAATGSVIRQAAADNPAISAAATSKGSTPQNIAALQAILQKANTALEVPHSATIAQHANLPADVSGVQAAVGQSFPSTLSGVSPEDAGAIQQLQQRLGTVNTLGGLNDLRQWLNDEAAAGYKQDGVAAARGTATKQGIRTAADAARNAYYDQLQQASGVDFRPIKAQQSALLNQQEGAAKLGQTLSAQQAIADEGKGTRQILADALTGGRALKAGPIAGTTQLIAEKLLKTTPLTQPNALIRRFLSDLPEPSPQAIPPVAPTPSNAPQLPASASPTAVTGTTVPPTPPSAPTPLLGNPQGQLPDANIQQLLANSGQSLQLPSDTSGMNITQVPRTAYPALNEDTARMRVIPNSFAKSVGTSQPMPVNYVKIGTDLDTDATLRGLPAIKRGFTRLYRSESPTTKFEDIFDTSKLNDAGFHGGDGKYYTDDLNHALYYKQTYGPDASTHYVDVPTEVANGAKVRDGEYNLNLPEKTITARPVTPQGQVMNPLQRFLQAGDLDPTITNPSADDLKRAIAGMRKKRGK